MTDDIFQDHNAVIHDHARGNGQGHERNQVYGVAKEIEKYKRGDQREGDGQGNDDSWSYLTQEKQGDQDDK